MYLLQQSYDKVSRYTFIQSNISCMYPHNVNKYRTLDDICLQCLENLMDLHYIMCSDVLHAYPQWP